MISQSQHTPSIGSKELASEVEGRHWYHTLDLAPDVTTPGLFDHRPYVERYGLPASLEGKRALDVGTLDGFWAFELERRGATVTALDIATKEDLDWPAHLRDQGVKGEAANAAMLHSGSFEIAHAALGSNVQRRTVSIYEATPELLGGTFDVVFCGSVLVHLRDPNLALERMADLCHGRLVLAEGYSRRLNWFPVRAAEFIGEAQWLTWWLPNTRAWLSMVRCAGFQEVRRQRRFQLRFTGKRGGVPHVVIHADGPARSGGA